MSKLRTSGNVKKTPNSRPSTWSLFAATAAPREDQRLPLARCWVQPAHYRLASLLPLLIVGWMLVWHVQPVSTIVTRLESVCDAWTLHVGRAAVPQWCRRQHR